MPEEVREERFDLHSLPIRRLVPIRNRFALYDQTVLAESCKHVTLEWLNDAEAIVVPNPIRSDQAPFSHALQVANCAAEVPSRLFGDQLQRLFLGLEGFRLADPPQHLHPLLKWD